MANGLRYDRDQPRGRRLIRRHPLRGICGRASLQARNSCAQSLRARHGPIYWPHLVPVAVLALLAPAPWFEDALAANCPINGSGEVTVSGTTCVIPPADTVHRITGSSDAVIMANGVHVAVPFGVGVTSQTGSLITFGVDPTAGASSIVSQFGGGGITVLLANGGSSRIDASDLNVTFGGGGNIMVEAQAGAQITLHDGTTIDILNSGGNQGLLATGANSRIIANNITETATVGGGDFGVHAQSGGEIDLTESAFNFNGTGGGETVVVAESHSTIVAQNSTFTATGGGGGDVAIKVDTGSNVALTGGSVTMTSRRRRRDRGVGAGSGLDLQCNRCSNHALRLGRRHRRQGGEWRRSHTDWRLGFGYLHRGWRERDLGDRRRQFNHRQRNGDCRPLERGWFRCTGRYGRNDCA